MVINMIFLEYFLTFILTFILIKLIKKIAAGLNLIDTPNARNSHKKPVVTCGGVAIVLSSLSIFLLFHFDVFLEYYYVFISIIIIFILGIIDDIKKLTPLLKLVGISAALIILCYNDYYINSLGTYANQEVHLHWFLIFPVTFFAVIGFTNALNLIDGLDGLAATVSIVILTALCAIGLKYNDPFIIFISSIFIVSLLAFLLFNWHPASIFMGDSGSLTLGFVISILGIKALEYISPTSLLFIAALPILNTVIVLYRRKQRHLSAFKADHIHLHDLILSQKRSIPFTVTILSLIQVVLSMIGYSSINNDDLFNIIEFIIIFYIFFSLFDQRVHIRGTK